MTIHRLLIDLNGAHKQGLRTHDAELAERWAIEAPVNAVASGHIAAPVVMQFDPAHGAEHGNEIIRSVHRLHADVVRRPDGSIEVRNLYHYPDAEPEHKPTLPEHYAAQHPLISKRQWVKIPQVASKRHWIVSQTEPMKVNS